MRVNVPYIPMSNDRDFTAHLARFSKMKILPTKEQIIVKFHEKPYNERKLHMGKRYQKQHNGHSAAVSGDIRPCPEGMAPPESRHKIKIHFLEGWEMKNLLNFLPKKSRMLTIVSFIGLLWYNKHVANTNDLDNRYFANNY